jgi:lysophospholipase L1-like esterase
MQDIDLDGDLVRFAGVQDVERTADAWVPRRLPAWTRPQIVSPEMQFLVGMPSGARLEMDTDSTAIELDVGLTLLRMGDDPTLPAAFDLVVDGELVTAESSVVGTVIGIDMRTGEASFEIGPPSTTVRFDGLAPGRKRVEIWLPHAAALDLRAVRIDDSATATPPAPDRRRRWVHYGSSISHCLEAARPTGVWPVVAARRADVALDSLAIAGQAHLDQLVARTIRDLPADLISMKVGINLVNADSMRERTFVPAVHGFLDTIRDGHPTTPLLVVTPILCPAHEHGPGPTVHGTDGIASPERPIALANGALTLSRIREMLTEIVTTRRAGGDEHLHLLDGRELFGEGDLADLPDGLHPNAAGYARMGERFHTLAFAPGAPFA